MDHSLTGAAKVLRIYIGESDKWHGRPLSTALVEMLREQGLAGATVTRGVEGYGANSRINTAHILRLSEELPLVVETVDRAERIHSVLALVDEMVADGMVTLSDAEVVHYRHRRDPAT